MSDQTETEPSEPEEPSGRFGFSSGVSHRTGQPFVDLTWGDRRAQVPPFIARQIGMQALEVAEAAVSDAAVFRLLVESMGAEEAQAGAFVAMLRDHRYAVDEAPEATFAFRETDFEDQGETGNLPEKVEGKHRWVVMAGYSLDDQSVALAFEGEEMHLDHENRFALTVGCYDCEQTYNAAKGEPCPGDPEQLTV